MFQEKIQLFVCALEYWPYSISIQLMASKLSTKRAFHYQRACNFFLDVYPSVPEMLSQCNACSPSWPLHFLHQEKQISLVCKLREKKKKKKHCLADSVFPFFRKVPFLRGRLPYCGVANIRTKLLEGQTSLLFRKQAGQEEAWNLLCSPASSPFCSSML